MKFRGDGTSAGHCIVHLVIALALLAAAGGCEPPRPELAHEAKLAEVHTVAVLHFVDAPGGTAKGSGEVVVGAAQAELIRCGIRVIERGRLKAILGEQDLRLAGLVDATTASKIGKLAGAELVILGEITQYEAQKEYSHVAVHMFSGGGTKTIHRVGLSLRAVSVADGQVIYAKMGQGTSQKGYSPALELAAKEAIRPLALFFKERYEKANAPKPTE